VRELENLITRACVLNQGGSVAAEELRPWLRECESNEAGPITQSAAVAVAPELAGARLDELERATIVATLQRFGGNRMKTAAALGIGVRTLSGKLRAYGFAPRAREFGTAVGERQNLPVGSADSASWGARRSA
jgi:DNA-binding NtrC family response regulator